MSIIVAVRKHGQIWVAADTQSNYGQTMCLPNVRTEKVWPVGDSFVGHVGYGVYEDLFARFILGVPAPNEGWRLHTRAQVYDFFLGFYGALQEAGIIVNQQPDDKESPFAGLAAEFVVAGTGGIFYVCADMGTSEIHQYIAIGSGHRYALGALHALYDVEEEGAGSLASVGVEAAMAFDINCGGEVALYPVVAEEAVQGTPSP